MAPPFSTTGKWKRKTRPPKRPPSQSSLSLSLLPPSLWPSEAPEPVVASEIPMPALVEPIADSGNHGDGPSFESDAGLPFSADSDQPFPPANNEPAAEPASPAELDSPPPATEVDPVKAPEAADAKREPNSELHIMDPDMDMDMEGLGEALRGDSSK